MVDSVFQHFIFQDFILPFILVFTLVFAVLEKTNFLGEGKKTLNAIIAFVIGLVFVTAIFPRAVVSNLILFLTVSIIVVFVIMLVWGFISGEDKFKFTKTLKIILMIAVGLAILFLIAWSLKEQFGLFDYLSDREWTSPFWTNFLFVVVIAAALALVLKRQSKDNG